jgi:hypothetical protein
MYQYLPSTIQCIGSNTKLQHKIQQNNTRQNEKMSTVKSLSSLCTAMQYPA